MQRLRSVLEHLFKESTVQRIAMIVVSLFAIGSLTFGARELLAESGATACMYAPPHQLGECSSQEQCQSACESWGGTEGDCSNGCCGCRL